MTSLSIIACIALLLVAGASSMHVPDRAANGVVSQISSRAGEEFTSCKSTAECNSPAKCLAGPDLAEECTSSDQACFCFTGVLTICGDTSGCSDGEVCAVFKETDSDLGFCVFKEVVDRDPTIEAMSCIAVEHLSHLSTDSLVFDRHVLARVLCDASGSCATPGHVVVFQGQPMMMSTYCKNVDCVSKAVHVNSPKYSKGMQVASKTQGLTFTALAARYETRVEETALGFAVRLGL